MHIEQELGFGFGGSGSAALGGGQAVGVRVRFHDTSVLGVANDYQPAGPNRDLSKLAPCVTLLVRLKVFCCL